MYVIVYNVFYRSTRTIFVHSYCRFVYMMLLLYKSNMYLIIFTVAKKEVLYNTMAVATTIPRYDKNQIVTIDNRNIKLIDLLKELRLNKKITKKQISNLIKHNDYWYSQIERDGKNGDDNRQRTIYRPDLIDIISIIQYDAKNSKDLELHHSKSEVFLDKIIKALPLKESLKKLELYQLSHVRTTEEQDSLLNSLLAMQEKLLRKTYDSLIDNENRDHFLNALKNTNLALKIDPLFIVFLMGLPYADFLYESKQEELFSLFQDIIKVTDDITKETNNGNIKKAEEYLDSIRAKITSYTGKDFLNTMKKNFVFLPPEEWS